jgi:hypothetical protein
MYSRDPEVVLPDRELPDLQHVALPVSAWRGKHERFAPSLPGCNDANDAHTIGAAAGAVSIVEWWPESRADALRVVRQRSNDELVRRRGNGSGQVLGELPPSRG